MTTNLRIKFDQDLEDSSIFLKEVLMVAWRYNPAGIAAHISIELFESINENTTPKEKSSLITEALTSIEIVPVETFEQQFGSAVMEICKNVTISELIKSATKIYPQTEDYLRSATGSEEISGAAFNRMTLSAIAKQRDHYQQLIEYYGQLIEYLPRYSGILNRSGFIDGIIGFTAGFFGGYVGAAGAEVWGNWRNSNDEEFCQKFANAFELFAEACYKYTEEGEKKLSVIFDRLNDEVKTAHKKLFDCYDELAKSGWDITPLHESYRNIDEPLDDETRHLFEIAISSLEENRSIHFRTIENLRSIIGLNEEPPPLLSTTAQPLIDDRPVTPPPLPSTVVSGLEEIPPLPESENVQINCELSIETVQNLTGKFKWDKLYLQGNIPNKKILGATGNYAPQVSPEMIIVLVDTTTFGSGKRGILITPSSLHWRNYKEPARFMPYSSIRTISISEPAKIMDYTEIILNDSERIQINTGSKHEDYNIAQLLIQMFKSISDPA